MVTKGPSAIREVPLCYNAALQRAARRLNALYNAAITPCGVDAEQLEVLIQVRSRKDPTLAVLSDYLVTTKPAMRRVVAAMVKSGLLAYVPDSSDKRIRRVCLTERGTDLIDKGSKLWIVTHRRLENLLGRSRTKDLRKTLDWMASDDFGDAFTVTR